MIARRIATLVATLLAVAGAGACGNAATTDPRRDQRAAIAPAPVAEVRAPSREVQAAAPASAAVRNVPSAFRLPPGSQVAALADDEAGASFTLSAPTPEAVLSFYRNELPRAAFTIVADHTEPGATSLSFRDADGWAGTIYATAQRATVAVRRA